MKNQNYHNIFYIILFSGQLLSRNLLDMSVMEAEMSLSEKNNSLNLQLDKVPEQNKESMLNRCWIDVESCEYKKQNPNLKMQPTKNDKKWTSFKTRNHQRYSVIPCQKPSRIGVKE